jgi:L-ascorbate metabolism protein UlaG (beta-lactamase superfamily)
MQSNYDSPNFRDGVFQNLTATPMMAEGVSTFGALRDFFNKPKSVRPTVPLPFIETELSGVQSDQPRLIWFGHSSYLIELRGINFLIDPVFSGAASPVSFMIKAFEGANTYGVEDMPPLDYLILTHDHYDHLDKKTVLALSANVKKIIVPLGVENHLKSWGIGASKIVSLDWWQQHQLTPHFTITSYPARHFSGRGLKRNGSLWTAYLLQLSGTRIFIGGDSGYGPHFKSIASHAGKIDLAILECGQYNKDWPYIHMLPEDVVQAHIDLGAQALLPVHWGKFALAYHAWNDPIKRVTAKATEMGVQITTPKIGEPVIVGEKYPSVDWWSAID